MLLTRPPLYSAPRRPRRGVGRPFAHDLHVLSAPRAFILSRDHTLSEIPDARLRYAILSTSQRPTASKSDESEPTIPRPLPFVKTKPKLRRTHVLKGRPPEGKLAIDPAAIPQEVISVTGAGEWYRHVVRWVNSAFQRPLTSPGMRPYNADTLALPAHGRTERKRETKRKRKKTKGR